ncbi:MAG: UDP-N-acetylmuramate--L-alanine ligase [Candidatus Pacebacteria bacterium]|nr:UDP-N-acetylmuramate--L-alanine ligase [Candidatus Paceibacterota bacterium]
MNDRIHFIGIGGIGVSSLAQYYLAKGFKVSGSDISFSEIIEFLKRKGIKISIGQKKENISKDISLVIFTPAIQSSNPELKEAKRLRIKTKSYSEALGELNKSYFTIAVSGAHGKSTTTGMLANVLIQAGLDPTVVIGTKLKEFGNTNFRMGKDKGVLLVEADEFKESFLNYRPKIIITTNIEPEHLDYYKNLPNILKAFSKFTSFLKKDGIFICNKDNENVLKIAKKQEKIGKVIYYSLKQKEREMIKKVLKIPGEHNISNALAVLSCARALKIKDSVTLKGLASYTGAWRRMETRIIKLKNRKVTIISDYGHHPTEIDLTVSAIKEKYAGKKIWLIFQPHQYQRTYYLFNDFIRVLSKLDLDNLVLAPIYEVAGRETKLLKQKVSSKKISEELNKKGEKTISFPTLKNVKKYIEDSFKGDVIIFMGAGDIYFLADQMVQGE